MADASGLNSIEISEHISPDATGDNIGAKRAAGYKWDGNNWQRAASGLITLPYDEIDRSNTDSNGNYQTLTTKLGGNTQQTLTFVYDASNNITSITRS